MTLPYRVVLFALAIAALAACAPSVPPGYLDRLNALSAKIDDYPGAGDTGAIRDGVQALIDEAPRLPHAYAEAAHALLFIGKNMRFDGAPADTGAAATQFVNKAIELDPGYCPTFWLRGQLEIARGQPQHAIATIDRAQAQGCHDPWQNVVRGRAAVILHDSAPALAALRNAVEAGPGTNSHQRSAYAAAMLDLARTYLQLGMLDDLRKTLTEWDARADLFDPWSRANAASLWVLLGEFDHGEQIAGEALRLMSLPNAHLVRATALVGKALQRETAGAPREEAEALWQQALAEKVDLARSLRLLENSPCCTDPAFAKVLQAHLAGLPPTP